MLAAGECQGVKWVRLAPQPRCWSGDNSAFICALCTGTPRCFPGSFSAALPPSLATPLLRCDSRGWLMLGVINALSCLNWGGWIPNCGFRERRWQNANCLPAGEGVDFLGTALDWERSLSFPSLISSLGNSQRTEVLLLPRFFCKTCLNLHLKVKYQPDVNINQVKYQSISIKYLFFCFKIGKSFV